MNGRGIEIDEDSGFKLVVEMERYMRVSFRLMSPATKPQGIVVNMPLDMAMDMVERVKERAKALSLRYEYPESYRITRRMRRMEV